MSLSRDDEESIILPEDFSRLSNIYSLENAAPTKNYDDLRYFDNIIGNATVIGVGEVTHGIAECFQMKHRLFEYLVKEKNFTIFSMEASCIRAAEINDYVLHGKGEPASLIQKMGQWVWDTVEVLALVRWMREYNLQVSNDRKIQFTGFDFQGTDGKNLKRALNDKNINTQIDDIYTQFKIVRKILNENAITMEDLTKNATKAKASPEYKSIHEKLTTIKECLEIQKNKIISQSGIKEFEWLKQNIRLMEQELSIEKNNALIHRDACMDENIQWLQKQNPEAKIMLWAHNGHIHKDSYVYDKSVAEPMIWMGQHLANRLGEKYKSIGFVAHHGTYTAMNNSMNIKHDLELLTPPENSLEHCLHSLNKPLLLMDMTINDLPNFLLQNLNCRVGIGAMQEPSQVESSFGPYNIARGYDGIIYIDQAHATQPILYKHALNRLHILGEKNTLNLTEEKENQNNIRKSH